MRIFESDENMRELERKAASGGEGDARRLIAAKARAGHYSTKTHRDADEYKHGLKKFVLPHPDLLKKAHDNADAEERMARDNYRSSDVPHHNRKRKMYADMLDSPPDFSAHNAPEQLHAWRRYIGLGRRLTKLSDRSIPRSVSTDRLVHKFGSEQGKHARRDIRGFPNTRTTAWPTLSAFDAARDRYINAHEKGRAMKNKNVSESDEGLRELERKAKQYPKDLSAWKRFNAALGRAGQKPQNPPRNPLELMSASHAAKERAEKIRDRGSRANEIQTNYKKFLRRLPTSERAHRRADELEARMSGNKRREVAAGRSRKLLKVLAKHAKTLPDDSNTADNKYNRIEYLANRAKSQVHDLNHYRKLGTNFKAIQNPERVSRHQLSTRTRRQHGLPGWKDEPNRAAQIPTTPPRAIAPVNTRAVCSNTLSSALCRKKQEAKPAVRHVASQHLKQAMERLRHKSDKK